MAPDGTELDKVDYSCQCKVPTGMRLDPDGSVWFAEAGENRIGHASRKTGRFGSTFPVFGNWSP